MIEKIYKQIKVVAKSQEYLELGTIDHMNILYPLQKLEFEEWERVNEIVQNCTQNELQLIADALIEIKNNKNSNYDTSAIYGLIFTISNDEVAECLLENFSFLDNNIPKKIELLDKLQNLIKKLEGKTRIDHDFTSDYALIYKLYNIAAS